ncbi:hypothetical protein ACIP5T_03150 [Microbacterium sp. NPDC088619]|uniref:hypothetical protein n=1 Tax=Microbacterium sp. NPDC088619 TaxID=3364196 RepID=UPI00380F5197
MSANDKVAAALGPDVDAVRNDLVRRRELKQMTKPELIDYIVRRENDLYDLGRSLEHAYGNEP